jgi:ubiquinone/menaquinone biosynthesis C-methylase UbiE
MAPRKLVDYDPFAELPLARDILRQFTGRIGIRPGSQVLDVGAGTGESASAILDCLRSPNGCVGKITLLEPEARLLEKAKERLPEGLVEYAQGYAQDLDELSLEEDWFDYTVWSNGIHYLEEEELLDRALRAIRRRTRVKFSAWTTFMSEAYLGRTARFAGLWALRAYRKLGIDPKKERAKSQSLGLRGSKEYTVALQRAGFSAVETRLEQFNLAPEVWESIARFGDYVRNALPDIPGRPEITLSMRSEALVETVREVYERLKVETLPRNWLYIEATP